MSSLPNDEELKAAIDDQSEGNLDRFGQLLDNHQATDWNSRFVDGRWTPLGYAARAGDVDKCRLLLEFGVDVDRKDIDGDTPLLHATVRGRTAVVELILSQLAFVDETDAFGWTALQLACHNGHAKVVQLLLEFGADPMLQDEDDFAPRDLAEFFHETTVINVLDQFSADKAFVTPDIWSTLAKHITTRAQLIETITKCRGILSRVENSNDSTSASSSLPSKKEYFTKILQILQARLRSIDATKIFNALRAMDKERALK